MIELEHQLNQATINVAAAPFTDEPFTHIVLDDVFPPDLYAALVENWPDPSVFVPLNSTGRVPEGTYEARSILDLTSAEIITTLPDPQRRTWEAVRAWMNGYPFVSTMIAKIAPYLEEIWQTDIRNLVFEPRTNLVIDDGEYALGPHTDGLGRTLVMLFYCPSDDTVQDQGTSVYWPKPGAEVQPGGMHHPFDLFNRLATYGFRPNRMVGFIRSDSSWHGVEPMVCNGKRRTLNWKLMAGRIDQ